MHIIKSDTKKVSSLDSTSAFTIVLVFCLFQPRTKTELTQREYSHFFHTRLYHCRSHPLWWGLLLHIFFRIGRETSRRRGVKLPSSYLSRIFDRITMHRTATRCRAAKVYREERKKNMKKTLKVSNSFSRYRTYPKLHMMHICTMGYIRIIPD